MQCSHQRIQPLDHIEGKLAEFKVEMQCGICHYSEVHHEARAIRSQDVADRMDVYIGEFTAQHAACGLELEDYDPPAFGPGAEKWNYIQTWGGYETMDPYSARIADAKANLDLATRMLDSFAQQEWANILNRLLEEQHYFKIKLDQARYEIRPTFLQPYLT